MPKPVKSSKSTAKASVTAQKHKKHTQALNDPQIRQLVKLTRSGPVPFTKLCDDLDLSPKRMQALIAKAQAADVSVQIAHDQVRVSATPPHVGQEIQVVKVPKAVSGIQRVAVISDTHLGSKYCLREQLREFVEHAYAQGVREVLHPGDILDGNYRHAQFEMSHVGIEDQTQDLFDVLPQLPGLTYHAITGNHDFTFTDAAGVSVGQYLEGFFRANGRKDFFTYGDRSAFLQLRGALIHLWHPKSGMGYARSYAIQKQIERYAGGEKPHVLLVGHWHSFCHVYERGVHGIACPTFQGGGSAFGKSLGGSPAIGGLLLSWELTATGIMRNLTVEKRSYHELETLWQLDQGNPETTTGAGTILHPPTRTGFARRVKVKPTTAERWNE